MRVVVVDDYPGAAEIACVLLRLLGHDARAAMTGREALEVVALHKPEVIVLDLGLPDTNGYEIAREIRRRFEPRPFIAAMTGRSAPEDRVQSLAAGIDMHVLKPASTENLTRIVNAARKHFSERAATGRA